MGSKYPPSGSWPVPGGQSSEAGLAGTSTPLFTVSSKRITSGELASLAASYKGVNRVYGKVTKHPGISASKVWEELGRELGGLDMHDCKIALFELYTRGYIEADRPVVREPEERWEKEPRKIREVYKPEEHHEITTTLELREFLAKKVPLEAGAYEGYQKAARAADNLGYSSLAESLRKMAADEVRHGDILQGYINSLVAGLEERQW